MFLLANGLCYEDTFAEGWGVVADAPGGHLTSASKDREQPFMPSIILYGIWHE
jgi:hypothetical protein